MMQDMIGEDSRTTQEVFERHLECRQTGDLEGDLELNYAPDVVMLTMEGVFRGWDGVRENARRLRMYYPDARFSFPVKRVAGRFAFLEWRAERDGAETHDGADSFVIENGRITCQTVRYTVRRTPNGDREETERAAQRAAEPDMSPGVADGVRVVRLGAEGGDRYLVEFFGENGEHVTVECAPHYRPGDGDERAGIIATARDVARKAVTFSGRG